MFKEIIFITILIILQKSNSLIRSNENIAFHLILNENIRKNIKHSVHGNKFVWIPEIKLSAIRSQKQPPRRDFLDYESLQHIFKSHPSKPQKGLLVKGRHLEAKMVRDVYPIKGKLHATETNLHNLKCQCVFRELPKEQPILAQKSVKKIKTRRREKHFRRRKNQHKKSSLKKVRKPSLRSCLVKKHLSESSLVLCDYFYKDLFAKLVPSNKASNKRHRKRASHRGPRFNKRKSNKKRLNVLRNLLKKKHTKHKKSNLVLLQIKD
jgi:hypothetical protein